MPPNHLLSKCLLFVLLFSFSLQMAAQTKRNAAISTTSSVEAQKKKLFDYLSSKLLAFGLEVKSVECDPQLGAINIAYENEPFPFVINLTQCDTNGISWDNTDKGIFIQIAASSDKYAQAVILSVDSIEAVAARGQHSVDQVLQWIRHDMNLSPAYDLGKLRDKYMFVRKYARFIFALSKVGSEPNFQDNITKTVKKLIVLCSH